MKELQGTSALVDFSLPVCLSRIFRLAFNVALKCYKETLPCLRPAVIKRLRFCAFCPVDVVP